MSLMARIGALACAVLTLYAAPPADNELTPQEKTAGWQLLFDGRSYAGWEDPGRKSPPGDSFTIDHGCLKATSHARITEDLFTLDTFGDFELAFDWKISPAGNSGVKYRIQDRVILRDGFTGKFEDLVALSMRDRRRDRPAQGQEYVVGSEYQITDNQHNPDARRGPLYQSAALYGVFPALRDVTRPVGEFNQARLVVRGKHIEHWLNGEEVLDGALDAPEVAASMAQRWGADSAVYHLLVDQPQARCRISLQNHGDEAWFKNVKIRRLPAH